MNIIVELEPGIYVADQLAVADLEAIARMGIRTIVDNRPDEEVAQDQQSATMAAAAADHRIAFLYRPVFGFELGDVETLRMFSALQSEITKPVVYYCRTGRRSVLLWAQSAVKRLGIETVTDRMKLAGIEPDQLLLLLEEIKQLAA